MHAATRKDVARRGLPGPAGMDPTLIDFALTARALPEVEWCWDPTLGDWRVATAADELPAEIPAEIPDEPLEISDVADVSDISAAQDGQAEAPEAPPADAFYPFERRKAQRRAAVEFEAWLAQEADEAQRRRVRAVVAERAAMHAARAHAEALRAAQASVGRWQGQQIRVLAAMAPLYRAAVHHPDACPEDADDSEQEGSTARRQREALEAAGLADLVAEVALLLAWTHYRAGKQVRLAEHLVGCLPRTMARLEAGRLDLALASVVADRTQDMDPQLARELDEEVFGPDGSGLGCTTAELGDVVDEVVARLDAAAVRRRSRRRVSARSVVKVPLRDGMARLIIDGPAPVVTAMFEHVDAVAGLNLAQARRAITEGRLPADGGDPYAEAADAAADAATADSAGGSGGAGVVVRDRRRIGAHRFDALATAVLNAAPAEAGTPRPRVSLEMHAALSTLCGGDEQPGWLEGHGWVPAWLVRQGLVWSRCRLRRVLTDPFTGDLITVDGHTYPASWLTDPGPPPGPRSQPHDGGDDDNGDDDNNDDGARGPEDGPGGSGPGDGGGGGDSGSGARSGPAATFHGRPIQQLPDLHGDPFDDDVDDLDDDDVVVDASGAPSGFAEGCVGDPAERLAGDSAERLAGDSAGDPAGSGDELADALALGWDSDPAEDSTDPCTEGTCTPVQASGCPLVDVDGGRYTPPAALDRLVRREWTQCSYPGCRRRAQSCDVDHVIAFRSGGPAVGGGTTCRCNLEPKCRRHHLRKHGTDTTRRAAGLPAFDDLDQGWVRWSARWQNWRCDRSGSVWRSPLGFSYHGRPRRRELPAERYRPTPWPPRNPTEEEVRGRRRSDRSPGQILDLLTSPEERTPRTARQKITFPDEPDF
ncbi:protein of unknown function [Quadrisphaera granulorum]|uniref:Uncharacterized protein DUF222 n=1 Tax=Quadrisphaera granulorum TaxID=317664 RepID=A0A316A8L8_9ACTN|nr:uncharacterized protein DUF222 [Quadrisphaera granulorum]SZE97106.1 protein of unknown function [Quadrisphaera granulorum]